MNTLKKALIANTIFSSISGIIMIILHTKIANLFGVQNSSVFWIVGIILLYFAGTISYEIKKQRRSAILWISVQDFLWVLGSLFLLLFNPFDITQIGNIIIGVIALIVLFLGMSQIITLRKMNRT